MADKKNVQEGTYYLDVEGHVTKKELERLQEKLKEHKKEWERINQRFMFEERQKAYYDSFYDLNDEAKETKSESDLQRKERQFYSLLCRMEKGTILEKTEKNKSKKRKRRRME